MGSSSSRPRPASKEEVHVVVLPDYETAKAILSWALTNFSKDETRIVITCISHASYTYLQNAIVSLLGSTEMEFLTGEIDRILNKLLAECENQQFEAETIKLDIFCPTKCSDLIRQKEIKKLVVDSELLGLLAHELDPSCQIWFISNGDIFFTRQSEMANNSTEVSEQPSTSSGINSENSSLLELQMKQVEQFKKEKHHFQQEQLKAFREVEELKRQYERILGPLVKLNSDISLKLLEEATQNFNDSSKIGEDTTTCVYKGTLRGTTVAIKKLNSHNANAISEFQQEAAILSRTRHPNIVALIGVCSEASAIVYEYLPNGTLQDRLQRVHNTPPLPWQVRTRIIGEICLALIFLHSNEPYLIVHGNLKPSKILLDANFTSKLSDFGVSHLLEEPENNKTTVHVTSHLREKNEYVDPEILRTGVPTVKSDIYSFGITILRIVTGKTPLNIVKVVKNEKSKRKVPSLVDKSAGNWPVDQVMTLLDLGLKCANASRKKRPDLVSQVWPIVEPLMKAASESLPSSSLGPDDATNGVPNHFICPIFKDIMKDPQIAADGFTYEASAIRLWFDARHSTSPMTNQRLTHLDLIPNRTLHSAIQEWLRKHPQSSQS